MTPFSGNIDARLDDKGRTFIPAAYRKILAEYDSRRVVLHRAPGMACLQLYPESVWNAKVEKFSSKLNPWDPTDQLLLMQYTSNAEILEPDSQGRVLIQKRWLEQIGIEQDVVFAGMLDSFLLWSPARYAESQLPAEDFAAAIKKRMAQQ